MNVAINGDRSCCLTHEIAPGVHLFAVAHGFGRIYDEPVAPAVLARLRTEAERRFRANSLLRAQRRAKGIGALLRSLIDHLNEYVRTRSGSHDDYVVAGCSLTLVLLVGDRAYLSHVGSTAAYLARDGYAVSLTKHDAFEAGNVCVLTGALGAGAASDAIHCTFSLAAGDSIVLSGRRLAGRRQTVAPDEQILVVRYEAQQALQPARTAVPLPGAGACVTAGLATLLFYALLCLH